MSLALQCDGCRRRIVGNPELTILRADGGRLDFCAAPGCGAAAWAAVGEATRPARLNVMRRRALAVTVPRKHWCDPGPDGRVTPSGKRACQRCGEAWPCSGSGRVETVSFQA